MSTQPEGMEPVNFAPQDEREGGKTTVAMENLWRQYGHLEKQYQELEEHLESMDDHLYQFIELSKERIQDMDKKLNESHSGSRSDSMLFGFLGGGLGAAAILAVVHALTPSGKKDGPPYGDRMGYGRASLLSKFDLDDLDD